MVLVSAEIGLELKIKHILKQTGSVSIHYYAKTNIESEYIYGKKSILAIFNALLNITTHTTAVSDLLQAIMDLVLNDINDIISMQLAEKKIKIHLPFKYRWDWAI